jgi:hypothetical protein
MPAAWSLPVIFFCLRHDTMLAGRCPHCGASPAAAPRWTPPGASVPPAACCASPDGCGRRLDAASPPGCAGIPAARRAQQALSQLLARVRDPAGTPASRRTALAGLTDLTITAINVAVGGKLQAGRWPTTGMLTADTLTTAFTMLHPKPGGGSDPLAAMVTRIGAREAPDAVPAGWDRASPALRARIAHARDPWLTPIERLRHATALAAPAPPAPSRPGDPDPAITRAIRLPDQIWANWAIRLGSEPGTRPVKFRSRILAALLIPHSGLPVREIAALAGGDYGHQAIGHQLGKLAARGTGTDALRILTELALAIDSHAIPVSYQRRRELAATSTLIDNATWKKMARDAGMHAGRDARAGHARRYLYEMLTGCSLADAPPHCRITSSTDWAEYHDFAIGVTADLAAALRDHARRILDANAMSGEPVQWEPPASWVTAGSWPGADPAQTDPGPIHRALFRQDTPPTRIAASLGISIGHLRHVLLLHPLPRPLRPATRGLLPRTGPGPGDAVRIEPEWLREEYLTWKRPLAGIAAQAGCNVKTLGKFARDHAVPLRRPGGTGYAIPSAQNGIHPRDLPEPLRQAMTGQGARRRIERLLVIAASQTLTQAAGTLRTTQSTLSSQLKTLEDACGGQLIERHPGTRGIGNLTPLGEQLCEQARSHLEPAVSSPNP